MATSLNNLALLYDAQGRYEAAAPLYQRRWRSARRGSGAKHPDVATSLNNLAELYRAQGRYEAAAPLYQRALAIYEEGLGAKHPDVAVVLENYAALLRPLVAARKRKTSRPVLRRYGPATSNPLVPWISAATVVFPSVKENG